MRPKVPKVRAGMPRAGFDGWRPPPITKAARGATHIVTVPDDQ